MITVHPQGELPNVGEAVGLQKASYPTIIKGHPACHHLIWPVCDGHGLQKVSLSYDYLQHFTGESSIEVKILE